MSDWARYWPVDLHVHTPASKDVDAKNFGSADDLVQAALAAGLKAIAVTDHNTASGCDAIAAAARDTDLVVLPGVEISTTEGHLLAIWEEGTASQINNEVLVRLGIRGADQGKLDIAASVGLADAAREVVAADGVAIAAHIDRPKGLLQLSVKAHLKRTLLEDCLHAVEITKRETQQEVEQKLQGGRSMAYLQGSDTWDSSRSVHALSAIGKRRTWIKAARPDLVGIRHALADPDLRIRLDPPPRPNYAQIERVEVMGGFLDGQVITLCPDLNCLLGGTGAGKSLVLEAIRYALDQQVDVGSFPAIYGEVESRLAHALGENGVIRVDVRAAGRRHRVERAFSSQDLPAPIVYQETADEWVEVDIDPATSMPIAAFSQGEILEYSRQPVGRMSLVDAGIDLGPLNQQISDTEDQLHRNAQRLIDAKSVVHELSEAAGKENELAKQVRELANLFKTDVVQKQESWKKEDGKLKRITAQVSKVEVQTIGLPATPVLHEVEANRELFAQVSQRLAELATRLALAESEIKSAIHEAQTGLTELQSKWGDGFAEFKKQLDAELEKVDPGSSLASLRAHLESLQSKLVDARAAKDELQKQAKPALEGIEQEREELLQHLHDQRKKRRELRRARVSELNLKAAGFVRLDIPHYGDDGDFRAALNKLKVGSRVREDVLDSLARKTHPLKFVRAMWSGDVNSLVNVAEGIDAASVARLLANIDERDLWSELLDIQLIDRPDVLSVKFRKPDDKKYAPIESLAHGQRCTAILVILLADGNTPVLVDQPEDALHAPWIEEYLVDRLRSLRGSRQYIFATRSPGIVVSGDAEQIITMKATAGHGEREASGSLERHDLNKLALHHLEGGPVPFNRRTKKLLVSTQSE